MTIPALPALLLGLLLFLGAHSASIVAPAWRDARAAQLGEPTWKGVYSLISLTGFALLVWGWAGLRAQPVVLWTPPHGLHHLTLLLMLPVFPLLLAAHLPGRVQRAAKHPMLAATKLWALAHLLANGTLGDVLLFGGFLAWAVADRISVQRRAPRAIPSAPAGALNDAIAVVGGLALYVFFLFKGHAWLIGVSPLV
ncbi:NnrU family protein [Aquabacterium sp.]|uniref:NnrU family protein n=1 Tax=Aquabacterium sp. TaxID=1872578 RepID=UPI0035B427B3